MERQAAAMKAKKERVRNGTRSAYDRRVVAEKEKKLLEQVGEDEERIFQVVRRCRDCDSEDEEDTLAQRQRTVELYDGDEGMWKNKPLQEQVTTVHNRSFNPRKPRKEFWVENSSTLVEVSSSLLKPAKSQTLG